MAKGAKVQDSEKDKARQEWMTPAWLFDTLNREFNFTVDAAASPHNAKLPRFWTQEQNGLAQDWTGERVFYNPPYNDIESWMAKAWDAALLGCPVSVGLVPPRTDSEWWRRYAVFADFIDLFRGRVQFDVPDIVKQMLLEAGEKLPSSNAEGSCLVVLTHDGAVQMRDMLAGEPGQWVKVHHRFRDAATGLVVPIVTPAPQRQLPFEEPVVEAPARPLCKLCGEAKGGRKVHSSLVNGSAHEDCVEKALETLRELKPADRRQAEELLRSGGMTA